MRSLFLVAISLPALTAQAVQGVVVDATSGMPIAGAYVSVYSSKPQITRTDAAGHFSVDGQGVPLQVVRVGYVEASNVPPRLGRDLTIKMTPEAVISGKVEDEDGFPVESAGVEVLQFQEINGERRLMGPHSGRSNDLGEYWIGGIAPGRYYLRVTGSNATNWDGRYVTQFYGGTVEPNDDHTVEVTAGEHRGRTDIRLVKFAGVTISGRLEGMSRSASGQQMPWMHLRGEGGRMAAFVPVQRDGTFVINHTVPGRYTLIAQSGNQNGQAGDVRAEMPVEVGATDVTGIVLKLHVIEAVDIPGTLVVDGGGAPGRMLISARPMGSRGITAHSDEDGSFVLKGLLPGHYDIQAMPEPLTPAAIRFAKSARLGETEVLQKGFDVDSQPVGSLKITVGKPITVSGQVVDAAGQPAAGLLVFFKSLESGGAAISGVDGRFQSYFRAAGDYRVYVLTDRNVTSDLNYLKQHETDFPPVRVMDGENPPIMLRWTQSQSQ